MLPVLILVAFLFHSPVGASFICYKCDNQTASGRELCSTQQALDKNNNKAVDNCTGISSILACVIQVTYKNNTVERFMRNCASSRVCGHNDTESPCKKSGKTTTCTSCCKGDYCNNGSGLAPPTATPTATPTVTTLTGPNMTNMTNMTTPGSSPLSLLYAIISALLFFCLTSG